MYIDGESVIVEFTSRGTTIEGTSFDLPIISVFAFSDGLIIRNATYYDWENP
jgi:ketosteroid isomerase-like protein